MKRIIIIGGTSSIAEHCARLWVQEPVDLLLVGRNQQKLDQIAQDLRVRGLKSTISTKIADFFNPNAIAKDVAEICTRPPDLVLIAHGHLPEQVECQSNLSLCKETLEINGVSPTLFAEAFATRMEINNHGVLAIIGSVAGDRGRKSNYAYGASKGMVERYAQGLQHRLASTNVKVILIKPGPTDTPMTSTFKERGLKLASPGSVAKTINMGISKGQAIIYAPAKWAYIMMVIRHLPTTILHKTDI